MTRKLRIAVSVFFGLLTVVLCVLWVRSYWVNEIVIWRSLPTGYYVQHAVGRFIFARAVVRNPMRQPIVDTQDLAAVVSNGENKFGFKIELGLGAGNNGIFLQTRCWWPVIATTSIAVAPWLPGRFSLRTLLIATTLVAVVLGLIVWAGRSTL